LVWSIGTGSRLRQFCNCCIFLQHLHEARLARASFLRALACSRDDQASPEALTQAVVALRQQLPGECTLVARQHVPRLRQRTLPCPARVGPPCPGQPPSEAQVQGHRRRVEREGTLGQGVMALPARRGKVGMRGKIGDLPPTCLLPRKGGGDQKSLFFLSILLNVTPMGSKGEPRKP